MNCGFGAGTADATAKKNRTATICEKFDTKLFFFSSTKVYFSNYNLEHHLLTMEKLFQPLKYLLKTKFCSYQFEHPVVLLNKFACQARSYYCDTL